MWRILPNANAGICNARSVFRSISSRRCSSTSKVALRSHFSIRFLILVAVLITGGDSRQANAQSPSNTQQPISILHEALLDSVWGKPVFSKVRQRISIFDKQMSGVGEYLRSGSGRGLLRFQLRFSAHDQLYSLLQICDGQRLLTIENNGDTTTRAEVDLSRVRSPLAFSNKSKADPVTSMYLAIGGQAETLRKLCQQYEWYAARNAKIGETPVWVLSGRLISKPPQIHALAETDKSLFADDKSVLVPTRAEVAIGTAESDFPFWLYSMVQTRSSSDSAASSHTMKVITEWPDPAPLPDDRLTPDLFHAPTSTGEPFSDETPLYLPPKVSRSATHLPAINR